MYDSIEVQSSVKFVVRRSRNLIKGHFSFGQRIISSKKAKIPFGERKFFSREPQFPSGSIQCRVYSRARPCRIFHCQEKMPHKIYVAASNGLPKNRPNHWQQHWFDGRSINSLWHFIASYCVSAFLFFVWVIISPKHPGFCSNSSPGFFSCPECSSVPKWRQSFRRVRPVFY